jgi:hypothetical protein
MRVPVYILIFSALLMVQELHAQVWGSWMSAEIEVDLPKKFTWETSLESRSIHTGGYQLVSYFVQGGLNYKISKRFDLALKYRLTRRLEEDMRYYLRTKLIADFKFDYPLGRFAFDYRARYHRITKTYINSEFDPIPVQHLRNKFEFSYDIRDNKMEPAVFAEFFVPLNGYNQGPVDEYRIGADLKIPLKKDHRIDAGLMYVHEHWETSLSGLIILLGYKYTLD